MRFNLADRIGEVISQYPSGNALEFQGAWKTWQELATLMAQVEVLLKAAGAAVGEPVGILLRNRPAHVAALLQVLRSRRCMVTINPFQGPEKLARDLAGLRVKALIADAQDWALPQVHAAAAAAGSAGLTLASPPDWQVGPVPGLEGCGPGPFLDVDPGTAVLMLSSGTTGPAKRIQLPGDKLERSFASAFHYENKRQSPGSAKRKETPGLLSTPLVHIGGLYFALDSMLACRPMVVLEKFNAVEWSRAVSTHKPKLAALPPAALHMVLEAQIAPDLLASLKAIRAGSAPLPPELQAAFERVYKIPVLNAYGATEFAGAVAGWSMKDHEAYSATKTGSVGRAQPGCELRIVDANTGDVLDADRVGILEVKAAQIDDVRWIRTTDLGRLDADGFLYIVGRADDAIIRGGFKVLPREVEAVLRKHPSVKEACVVGLPDPRLGAVPVAAVELKEGAPRVSGEELMALARNELVSYQVPTEIRVVQTLPRTAALKVSQHETRELFLAPA